MCMYIFYQRRAKGTRVYLNDNCFRPPKVRDPDIFFARIPSLL